MNAKAEPIFEVWVPWAILGETIEALDRRALMIERIYGRAAGNLPDALTKAAAELNRDLDRGAVDTAVLSLPITVAPEAAAALTFAAHRLSESARIGAGRVALGLLNLASRFPRPNQIPIDEDRPWEYGLRSN